MRFHVRLSKSARQDADDAYTWMKEHHSEAQAIRWFNGLVDAVNSLEEMPLRCPAAPEGAELGMELRHLLYGKRSAAYRLVYAVVSGSGNEEGTVHIYRIWHGARDRIRALDLDDDVD